MERLHGNLMPIDTRNWIEVLEHQTYKYPGNYVPPLLCHKCGDAFKLGERVTYCLTKDGMLHFHENRCLKAEDIQHGTV